MNLARQILLQTEEKASYGRRFVELDFGDVPKQVLSEHVKLLTEAGLIESRDNSREATLLPTRLTWQGHEFLDAAKNEAIWQKTKKLVQEKGGALTFDVAKAVLAQVALKQVGI
jgi:DNA-binding transcriptional ArsR family regulator